MKVFSSWFHLKKQIEFLRRFYQNDLPFLERSLSIVKDTMILEQTPDYTLRAKTGWATQFYH